MWSSVDGSQQVEQDPGRRSFKSPTMDTLCVLCAICVCLFASSFFMFLPARIHQTSIEVTSDLVCCELSVNLVSLYKPTLFIPQLFFSFAGEHLQKVPCLDGVLTHL